MRNFYCDLYNRTPVNDVERKRTPALKHTCDNHNHIEISFKFAMMLIAHRLSIIATQASAGISGSYLPESPASVGVCCE
jgi:hypothetical protein